MGKYVIGIDYGTLSARALLVSLADGTVAAQSEYVYPHGILKEKDFQGVALKATDAFQHPQDYVDALSFTVKDLLRQAGVEGSQVAGLGIDFTACTVLPVNEDGTPLCFVEAFQNEPQAYVKLWKHQSAQQEAEQITALARQENAPWLETYGGKISAEWFFPKLLETLRKAPSVFDACHSYLEAGDWLVKLLTGEDVRSSCMAGYKAMWSGDSGFPDNAFFAKLDPRLSGIIGTKVSENVLPVGTKAGAIHAFGSKLTGLPEGTAVAVPIIDAHTGLPAAGITESGKMVLIIGTSSCQLILNDRYLQVGGISGSVKDGVLPGLTGMEAGQAAVGDMFAWFVENAVPEETVRQAEVQQKSVYQYLTEKVQELKPGQSGLLALDWFNGCRAPYCDGDLTGMILGLHLHTKPEEIFRALIEATAFGTKQIVETFEKSGVEVREVYATGGIPHKNPFMMQLYADVLEKEVRIVESTQSAAKGSAILAASACGAYPSVAQAAKVIADKWEVSYLPNRENTKKYRKLYEMYKTLGAYFAKNPIMKDLKNI